MKFWLVLLLTAALVGCASVPPGAATLAEQLGTGLQRNQAEVEKITHLFADTERAVLDEKWDALYADTEKRYLAKRGLASAGAMKLEDRRRVAAIAAAAREKLLSEIALIESNFVAASQKNTKQLTDITVEIQKYLLSLQKLDESRAKATELIQGIGGLDLKQLSGMVTKKLSGE
jgi:hypothetical protein